MLEDRQRQAAPAAGDAASTSTPVSTSEAEGGSPPPPIARPRLSHEELIQWQVQMNSRAMRDMQAQQGQNIYGL